MRIIDTYNPSLTSEFNFSFNENDLLGKNSVSLSGAIKIIGSSYQNLSDTISVLEFIISRLL